MLELAPEVRLVAPHEQVDRFAPHAFHILADVRRPHRCRLANIAAYQPKWDPANELEASGKNREYTPDVRAH